MNKLLCKQLITLGLLCLLSISTNEMFSRSLEPNKLMKDTTVAVIDTIRAGEIYNRVKPTILNQLNKLKYKYSVCEKLIQSKKNKVESNIELQILQEAYKYALSKNPELRKYKTNDPQYWTMLVPVSGPLLTAAVNSGRDGKKKTEVYDKNVKKGKLTDEVKSYLSIFARHMDSQIKGMSNSMKYNWTSFVKDPPTKFVTTQIENPYYRGYHYDNEYILDKIDKSAMIEGVEFLFSKEGRYVNESYPTKISYMQFPEIPNYRVTYDENKDNKIREIYDNKGNLVYVPYLDRNEYDIFKEFKRIVYFDDYKNNKYNIKSEKQSTQNFLNLWIGRKNGFKESQSELASMQFAVSLSAMFGSQLSTEATASKVLNKVTDYRDAIGENFLEQLNQDHSNDFGYIYSIERIGDKQFRVVYLNKETLSPSICGIVSFENGVRPYTSTYSVSLCDLPYDVPPVIRH